LCGTANTTQRTLTHSIPSSTQTSLLLLLLLLAGCVWLLPAVARHKLLLLEVLLLLPPPLPLLHAMRTQPSLPGYATAPWLLRLPAAGTAWG
jgi:hypothetical protein